jgi:tRNA threonylcarbamoyladenosine biosynthesis protein TsaE
MNHYSARHELYHFDLYRLSDPDELIELGFDEYAFGSGVALVEWPEKLENDKVPGLWVDLHRIDDDRRKIKFSLQGDVDVRVVTAVEKICQ